MPAAATIAHRVQAASWHDLVDGQVRYAWKKSLWFIAMAATAIVGGALYASWSGVLLFALSTGCVLLLGHSLGSHRKLIHDSYQCPAWLAYLLIYLGVLVGLAGPLGLLRQHELRDYAQRQPDCHAYLRHGTSFWRDFWWQVHCDLVFERAPDVVLEPRIAGDRMLAWLERTWMLQQLPVALLLYAWGGMGFVVWGVCPRVTAGILGHWLIGHFAHNHGDMSHEVEGAAVQGRNIRFTSLLTMGECWHNNHHAYPGSARLGLYRGEWDPGWWLLCGLRRVKLVWALRLPEDLPARAELRPLRREDDGALVLPCPTVAGCRALVDSGETSWMLSGPATWLSAARLRRIAGAERFRLDGSRRLVLRAGPAAVRGLPALVSAAALRAGAAKPMLMALLPLAVGVERLRVQRGPTSQ